jgi:hypothetical protein
MSTFEFSSPYTITLPDGTVVTCVRLPANPAPASADFWASDSVALITFPFTGQTQAQGSTGADLWGMTLTYNPLKIGDAAPLRNWLKQMRGMSRAVQLAPPDYFGPQGSPSGSPVTVGAQVAGATTLNTTGWPASATNLLQPDDCIQIGYRLYFACATVGSDPSGNASFEIWPSLRDDVTAETPVVYTNPVGLFRLAQNKRNWSAEPKLTHLSFPLVEYR